MENCIYARTSTEEQGESISNQIQYLEEYCSNNNIKLNCEPYIDEHTGVNFNRPRTDFHAFQMWPKIY